MKYPGGYSDEAWVSLSQIRDFLGKSPKLELWRSLAEMGIPLREEGEKYSGPALPFLLLLEEKGIPDGASGFGVDFPYYFLLEAALKDPSYSESLFRCVDFLSTHSFLASPGGSSEEKGGGPGEGVPKRRGRKPSSSKSKGEETEDQGTSITSLEKGLALMAEALSRVAERVRFLEEQMTSFHGGEWKDAYGKLSNEVATWNDHVRYLNDELSDLKDEMESLRKEMRSFREAHSEELKRLGALIERIRKHLLPN